MTRFLQRPAAWLVLATLSASGCQSTVRLPENRASLLHWQVAFSPRGGATKVVVDALARAKRSILVQAYSFTSPPIAQALVDAKSRGVAIEAILDKSQPTAINSEADFLADAGIPVRIDAAHAIAHNKVMVIDGETVVTGSFNFTTAAEERNAENVLVIDDKTLAEKYTENWQQHFAHPRVYAPSHS